MKNRILAISFFMAFILIFPAGSNAGIIIDDPDAAFSSNWTIFSDAGALNDSARYAVMGDGTDDNAVWRPVIASEGDYDVYTRWVPQNNNWRSTEVTYSVYNDAGGSAPVLIGEKVVDQTFTGDWVDRVNIDGVDWVYLGTFFFAGGSSQYVYLDDNVTPGTGTYTLVIADAVLFQQVPIPGAIWLLGSGLIGLAGWRKRTRF